MKEIRQRVRVREDGRLEIHDAALVAGAEAEVVVRLPEAAGDGARDVATLHDPAPLPARPGGLPLVDEHGKPVFLPPTPPRPGASLMDLFGLAPSGRTAQDVDRELRALRDEWDRDLPGR